MISEELLANWVARLLFPRVYCSWRAGQHVGWGRGTPPRRGRRPDKSKGGDGLATSPWLNTYLPVSRCFQAAGSAGAFPQTCQQAEKPLTVTAVICWVGFYFNSELLELSDYTRRLLLSGKKMFLVIEKSGNGFET